MAASVCAASFQVLGRVYENRFQRLPRLRITSFPLFSYRQCHVGRVTPTTRNIVRPTQSSTSCSDVKRQHNETVPTTESIIRNGIILLPLLAAFSIPGNGAAASGEFSTTPAYSPESYYTSLGLFVISIPGLWSIIKRSTKSKIVKKTFVVDGPGKPGSKSLSVIAAEITSFLGRRNYSVADRGEVVTFEGVITPSRSQAGFLVFCTLLSLLSVSLVLSIAVPDVGDRWYWLTAISPLSGVYYWRKASRTEQVKVKMVISDDEQSADVIIQGDDEEVQLIRKELGLMEKGMVYVKGLLE